MNKAEERALRAYPPKIDGDSRGSYDFNELNRIKYLQGYHQAEKDMELTWEDIESIITISYFLDKEEETTGKYAKIMTHCEEVLKRFNEQKKKK